MGSPDGKAPRSAFLRFTSMAYQMGAAIGLGVWLGLKADERWGGGTPWFTVLGSLVGTGTALYVVIKESSK
jgi:F0F1-type ATP synthase assembly protein I